MNVPDAVTSIVDRLALIPAEADAALVLRHAEREAIPEGTFGQAVPLTARGVTTAEQLGAKLSEHRARARVVASALPRCVETGEAVLRGGGWGGEVARDWRLGDPGPFVVEPEFAGGFFLENGIWAIVRRQLSGGPPLPGMRTTSDGVALLLALATGGLGRDGRLSVYVTHDAILAVLVAHLFPLSADEVIESHWPQYLDGLLLWRSDERLHRTWRGLEQAFHPIGG